ncbi:MULTISPECIES: heptaprenyl diphosphate synthase component II [Alteribacter]|uniref:Heptaprenyl diphosphate synthase component 2 n=1 Tax=Alteribacter keqinensis TaxID=2483800 RepID=A0A3M7TUL4_9BACI|nr:MULTISPECIES: heptaprenyl diphosphate synthase component II [Alteribacter]MBM7094654.1 heptaprenyl diphosphate synthase component II [Alteribacter salitolerans]RNA69143.1 heptaprenyl diphosphate synthase component II [Alteribacter keqinensis]
MKLTEIYWHLRSDISMIEKELEQNIGAKHPVLKKASTHLLKAGGKRIRPVFVLLAGQFGNYSVKEIKNVAVPLELIHMASLVHDDVIDNAELRRGEKTIKSKWDNRVAMYTGDFMFARAVELAAESKQPEVHDIISDAMVEMCIGEVEQIQDQYNWDQNLRTYLRRIKRKTALLIAVSCELGAVAGDTDSETRRKLSLFGHYVGMAFQITDDILDFVGTEKELGKPAGSDLKQGNVTLPALCAMNKDPELKVKISSTIKENDLGGTEIKSIIEAIKDTGAITCAKQFSDRYLQKARETLQDLPDIHAKTALLQIADYIGKRKF